MGKKIYLTERQFKEYIMHSLNENFISEINSRQIKDTQTEISDRIATLIQNQNPEVIDLMNRLGFNITNRSDSERENLISNLKDENGKISREVSDEILSAAEKLKKYINSKSGINFNLMNKELPKSEVDYLLRMRDVLDRIGLNALYDSGIKHVENDLQYGLTYNDDGSLNTDNFDLNAYTEKKLSDFGDNEAKLYTSLLNRYVDGKYGINFELPGVMFSNGSHKLPDDTLIINFTSAERCPAWNECIVKNACYARATEKFRGNVMQSNSTKNVMWIAGKNDPELLSLLFKLMREYTVNYTKLSQLLKKQGIKMSNKELSSKHFSELPEEAISIISNPETKVRRIADIRLNENGDFIGQWLVDAVDKEAGDFKVVGINTAAYTCRNLNFQGVKNIILNVSNKSINGNMVKRRFFALEENIYNAYDETYGGKDNSLEIKDGVVVQNPQPLYKNGRPTGEYYYKCPCGRLGDGDGGHKADCYMCRTCYSESQFDKPYYVFVKVHGTSKDEFKNNRREYDFGVSANYSTRLASILGNKGKNKENNNKESNLVAESVNNTNSGENMAINQIANNAISSMNNHLNDLSNDL